MDIRSEHSVRMIHFFVNFDVFNRCTCILVKTTQINSKLGDFVNLGVPYLTMWINSY